MDPAKTVSKYAESLPGIRSCAIETNDFRPGGMCAIKVGRAIVPAAFRVGMETEPMLNQDQDCIQLLCN